MCSSVRITNIARPPVALYTFVFIVSQAPGEGQQNDMQLNNATGVKIIGSGKFWRA